MEIIKEQFVWDRLSKQDLPIVLYGMGNGADKILDICEQYSIKVADIFASDEFVRGHSFRGYTVLKYSDILKKYDNCIILITFACFKADMLKKIDDIKKRYEILAPEVPIFGTDIFTPNTYNTYKEQISTVYNLLGDEKSKQVYECLLNYKISGKIEYLNACTTPRDEIFENLIHLKSDEEYVDLGAFCGDTIEEFLKHSNNKYKSITAFEPAEKNFARLNDTIKKFNLKNVTLVNKAAYSSTGKAYISQKGGRNPFICDDGFLIETASVDDTCKSASFIKFDVEGAESAALDGCKNIIKKYTPTLLVSAYHKTNDFFELPLKILNLNRNYKIYIRHQPYIPAWETNIIAKND